MMKKKYMKASEFDRLFEAGESTVEYLDKAQMKRPGLINSTDITFSRGNNSVKAVISFTGQYNDDSPVFAFFVQNQPATVKLSFGNIITVEGATNRTISFNKAVCRDYRESYDRQKQFDDFVEILIVFTIEADNAAMVGTNFPG